MADIKQLKIKIQSTKNIKKITNALEIISTIKLQKTKKKTEHLRDYVHSLLHIIALMMAKGVTLSDRVYTDAVIERSLLVVIASEKGLCGSLNSQLFKSIDTKYSDRKDTVHIYAVGKKAVEFFSRRGYKVVGKTFLTDNVDDDELLDMFAFLSSPAMARTYTHIDVCYNYFKNVMKQIPLSFSLFPMTEETITEFMQLIDIPFDIQSMMSKTIDIVVEPDMQMLQKHVKRMIIDYIVYGAILHNKTGEFAARMIAMKGAKDNAVNIISDLTLSYNKARQDAITKEVLEIVSAKAVIED